MSRPTGASSAVAAVSAAITFLIVLKLMSGSGGDAFMAFLAFSVFSLGAALLALLLGMLFRRWLTPLLGMGLGVAVGTMSVALLFSFLTGTSKRSLERAKSERLQESRRNLARALALGFPDVKNPQVADSYQLDYGPNVVLLAPESIEDACSRLITEATGWQSVVFSDGCWIARVQEGQRLLIRVEPRDQDKTTITYVVGAQQQRQTYYFLEKFLRKAAQRKWSDASRFIEPQYLERLGGESGLKRWFVKKEFQNLGGISLNERVHGYGQYVGDQVLLIRPGSGALPLVEDLSVVPARGF